MVRVRPTGLFVMSFAHPDLNWRVAIQNGTTVEGVNYLLNQGFRGTTQFANWYIGLIDNSGFSAISTSDTNASHTGWSEFTGLFGGNRALWSPIAANGGLMDAGNSSLQITASGTVRGALLASAQAIGTGSGVLYATGVLSTGYDVLAGGTLTLSYKTRLQG